MVLTENNTQEEFRPLLMAVVKQNPEITELLLKAGADPNESVGPKKYNALVLASGHHSNAQIVKLLLDAGANPNLQDFNQETPLMYAALLKTDINIIKMLLKAGADPNIRNNHDATALLCAVASNYPDAVKLLLEAKATPDIINEYNKSPIALAAESGNNEIVKILLQHGANPNGNTDSSWDDKKNFHKLLASVQNSKENPIITPLAYASYTGNAQLVYMLLKAGANPNIPNSDMNTPLLFAVSSPSNNRFNITEMLLQAGADINYYNFHKENKTAYEFATDRNDLEMLKLLKKYGAQSAGAKSKREQKLSISEDGGITVSK